MLVLPLFLALLATCKGSVEFSKSLNDFSVKLSDHTLGETQWHQVKSPLGIWSLLTAVTIGATGKSRDQLLHTLNLPKTRITIISNYKKIIKSVILPSTSDVQLKSNNFLFLDTGFNTELEFIRSFIIEFGANLKKINFKSAAKAADIANSFIQEADKSISNVFKPDNFNDARMILTNTISFKGHWKFPFNVSETRVQDFYDDMGKVVGKVNMMHQEGNFQYYDFKKISASVLELPYGETDRYSFLAVLPYEDVKLADVYNGLKSLNWKDILNQMKASTDELDLAFVVVDLPRFKISMDIVLNTPLINMGLVDIFDPVKASFNLISKTEKLYISTIVHKADIEVTETGTTASAATSAFYSDRSFPSEFNANRPFLYFIIEKSTTTVIFSGAYSIPTLY